MSITNQYPRLQPLHPTPQPRFEPKAPAPQVVAPVVTPVPTPPSFTILGEPAYFGEEAKTKAAERLKAAPSLELKTPLPEGTTVLKAEDVEKDRNAEIIASYGSMVFVVDKGLSELEKQKATLQAQAVLLSMGSSDEGRAVLMAMRIKEPAADVIPLIVHAKTYTDAERLVAKDNSETIFVEDYADSQSPRFSKTMTNYDVVRLYYNMEGYEGIAPGQSYQKEGKPVVFAPKVDGKPFPFELWSFRNSMHTYFHEFGHRAQKQRTRDLAAAQPQLNLNIAKEGKPALTPYQVLLAATFPALSDGKYQTFPKEYQPGTDPLMSKPFADPNNLSPQQDPDGDGVNAAENEAEAVTQKIMFDLYQTIDASYGVPTFGTALNFKATEGNMFSRYGAPSLPWPAQNPYIDNALSPNQVALMEAVLKKKIEFMGN